MRHLTLFSLTQTNPVLYQTILSLTNSDVGVGQLPTFRFGVDPLPQPPPGFSISDLLQGSNRSDVVPGATRFALCPWL